MENRQRLIRFLVDRTLEISRAQDLIDVLIWDFL